MKVKNLNEYKLEKIITGAVEAGAAYDAFYKDLSFTKVDDKYLHQARKNCIKKKLAETLGEESPNAFFYRTLEYINVDEKYLAKLNKNKLSNILMDATKEEATYDTFYEDMTISKLDDQYFTHLSEKKISSILTAATEEEDNDAFFKGLKTTKVDDNYLTVLLRNRKRRRKVKVARAGKIVAVLASVFVLSTAMAIGINEDFASAIRGQLSQFIAKDNKYIMKDEGYGDLQSKAPKIISVDSWEQIQELKKAFPFLIVPMYIPENYSFEQLSLEQNDKNYNIQYLFSGEKEEKLTITQSMIQNSSHISSESLNVNEKIEINNLDVYLSSNSIGDNESAVYFQNNDKITISGLFTKNDLIKIIKGMK